MEAIVAIGLILLCSWGAAQLPDDEPVICQSSTGHGLTLSFKATLVLGAVFLFLMGGVKPPKSYSQALMEMGLAGLVLFLLDAARIVTPFGNCL